MLGTQGRKPYVDSQDHEMARDQLFGSQGRKPYVDSQDHEMANDDAANAIVYGARTRATPAAPSTRRLRSVSKAASSAQHTCGVCMHG